MGLVRLFVFGLIGLTVAYLAVAWFVRSTCRERLEKKWDSDNPEGNRDTRTAEVEKGVEAFRSSLTYRALWLIYIVPTLLVLGLLISTNWN